jgi:general secretion pathway protein F
MPDFDVRLMEGARVVHRQIEAPDAQAVASLLGVAAAQILSVTALAPAASAKGAPARAVRFPLRLFSKEVAVLLGAGIPLLEAMQTLLEKESQPGVAAALCSVLEGLQGGVSFSQALASRPDAFDELFVAVVASAERTGQLQQALAEHARYLAWVETLREKLIGACIYPLILVGAGAAVLVFLLVFVVPRFAGLIEDVGGDVPAASRLLLSIGGWTGAHPWLCLLIAAAVLALPALAWRLEAVRRQAAALMWALPGVGEKLRVLALARLYRTLGMLLGAGVPLVPALRTARVVTVDRLRPALERLIDGVSRGERLSQGLEREQLGTPVSVRMVRVGERSGSVGAMFSEAAAFYDEELTRLSELITRLVNPVLMLVMGGVIGAVVVLMYLPIFQLMEQVQQ